MKEGSVTMPAHQDFTCCDIRKAAPCVLERTTLFKERQGMKKLLTLVFAIAVTFSLSAFAQSDQSGSTSSGSSGTTTSSSSSSDTGTTKSTKKKSGKHHKKSKKSDTSTSGSSDTSTTPPPK